MHGHHGWGGGWGGWGHHRGWGGGWGFGLGWLIPALLVGRVISDTVARPNVWPAPLPVVPPAPNPQPQTTPRPEPQSAGTSLVRCRHCEHEVQKGFAFCPHCGQHMNPTACQYCGHKLLADAAYCGHCGGPAR